MDARSLRKFSRKINFLFSPKVQRERPPLHRMEFGVIGKLERSRDEIKSAIERLGGKLAASIHDKMAAVISNEAEVEKMKDKMQQAKTFGIQIVSVKFLDEVKAGNAIKYIKTQSICDWGSDVSWALGWEFVCICSLNCCLGTILARVANSSGRDANQVEEHVHQIGTEVCHFEAEK